MSLEEDIARIEHLDKAGLLARWQAVHGKDAPPNLSTRFIKNALAYELQVRCFGDVSAKTRSRLRRIARRLRDNPDASVLDGDGLCPGTRLTRDWHGTRHIVEVLSDGYAWQGATYNSLSEIARRITGARWSGPRFFGLRTRRKAA